MDIISYMLNGYLRWPMAGFVVPHIGAGIGIAGLTPSVSVYGNEEEIDTASAFAYQLIAGVGFKIGDGNLIYIDYRYFDTGNAEAENENWFGGYYIEGDYTGHNLILGIRFGD